MQERETQGKDKLKTLLAALLYLLVEQGIQQKTIRAKAWALTGIKLPKSTCSDYVEMIRELNNQEKTGKSDSEADL